MAPLKRLALLIFAFTTVSAHAGISFWPSYSVIDHEIGRGFGGGSRLLLNLGDRLRLGVRSELTISLEDTAASFKRDYFHCAIEALGKVITGKSGTLTLSGTLGMHFSVEGFGLGFTGDNSQFHSATGLHLGYDFSGTKSAVGFGPEVSAIAIFANPTWIKYQLSLVITFLK